MNGNYTQTIISIEPPVKSHSSGGRWICYGFIESSLGNHQQNSRWEFWRKDNADKFYTLVIDTIKAKGCYQRIERGYVGDYR